MAREGKMQTLLLTMPELERAARQWASDFLNEPSGSASVATNRQEVEATACEGRGIVLFERAPAEVLRHVLQNGGRPWLVSDIVNRTTGDMHYRM
jgi:hypothetical protein